MIRVLIAEDHAYLREQLAILLDDSEWITVVGDADNGKKAVDLCGTLQPDVVLMEADMPFVVGFTAFFVLLGVGAALVGGRVLGDQFLLERIAGFVLVVFGLAFMGLLPWPERLVGAGLLQEARGRGSRVLLGGAFAVCAAPCIGPVLAAILVLAGSSDTAFQGAALLGVYSLGLAVPFVLAAALFTRAMSAFRWLRDHYRVIQVGGGAIMVALGLLLFFERFYVLRVYLNRFLEWLGLEPAF